MLNERKSYYNDVCLLWYDHVIADRCSKTVFGPAYRVPLTTAYTSGAVEAVMRSRLRPRLRHRSYRSTRSPGPGRIRSPNGGFHFIYIFIYIYFLYIIYLYLSLSYSLTLNQSITNYFSPLHLIFHYSLN